MRPTKWFVLFKGPDGEGQPAIVQGGRRFRAVNRIAALCPKGWKLDMVHRIRKLGRKALAGDDAAHER